MGTTGIALSSLRFFKGLTIVSHFLRRFSADRYRRWRVLQVFKLVHDSKTDVKIYDCGNRANPFADIFLVRRHLYHFVVKRFREEMIKDINSHSLPSAAVEVFETINKFVERNQ
jgi:hypothetical protein